MRLEDQRITQAITADRDSLAAKVVDRQYTSQPELAQRYGAVGRERCLSEVKRHFDALGQAIAAGRSALFVDYVAWAKIVLQSRKNSVEDLATNLEACYQALGDLPPEVAAVAQQFVLDGISCLPSLPKTTQSFISADRPLAALAREYLDALLNADRREAGRLVTEAVRQGTSVRDVYLHVFQRSQYEVGRLWQMNQISVGQEHLCTAATQLIMSQFYPLIFGSARKGRRVVAACVGGDLHEIGLRMVADFLEMDGWDTSYLGADVPTHSIVQATLAGKAQLLAISTTLLMDLGAVDELITAVRAHRDLQDVRILVGGYPFNVAADLWQDVGADGSAPDALRAIEVANQLLATEDVT